jgi:hypothetical protein
MIKINKNGRLKFSGSHAMAAKAALATLLIAGSTPTFAQSLEHQWAATTLGAGLAYTMGVAYDTAQNVYIAGTFTEPIDVDPGPGTTLLTPQSLSSAAVTQNVFIAKYNASGQLVWAKAIAGSPDLYGSGNHLTIDAEGNLILVGTITESADFDPSATNFVLTSAGGLDIFIAKYDPDGNLIWAKSTGGAHGEWASAVGTDRAGNIVLSGTFDTSCDFDPGPGTAILNVAAGSPSGTQDNYLASYDKNGNYLWAHRMGGAGTEAENGNGVAVGPDGSIVSTGAFEGICTIGATASTITSSGGRDAFLLKRDSSGAFVWAIPIGGTAGDDYGYDVAIDKDGSVYAAGYFQGTVDFDPGPGTATLTANSFYDGYLAKYDANGNYQWAFNVGAGFLNMFMGVSVDDIGNVYTAGFFSGTADFDPGSGVANLTAASGMNGFAAKYNAANGNYLWAGVLESPFSNTANMIEADAGGTVYVTGSFSQEVDMDPGTGTDLRSTSGIMEGFVWKLACDNNTTHTVEVVSCDSVYVFNGKTHTLSGSYVHHMANSSHCDSTIMLQLTIAPLIQPEIVMNGSILSTIANYSTYQWIKDGVDIPGATNSTLLVAENANYQVRVTNEYNCEEVSAVYEVTGVNSVREIGAGANNIHIYPNPATNTLFIDSPEKVNAVLMGLEGKVIKVVEQARTISLEGLSQGIYYLKLTDNSGRVLRYEKVIKKL